MPIFRARLSLSSHLHQIALPPGTVVMARGKKRMTSCKPSTTGSRKKARSPAQDSGSDAENIPPSTTHSSTQPPSSRTTNRLFGSSAPTKNTAKATGARHGRLALSVFDQDVSEDSSSLGDGPEGIHSDEEDCFSTESIEDEDDEEVDQLLPSGEL